MNEGTTVRAVSRFISEVNWQEFNADTLIEKRDVVIFLADIENYSEENIAYFYKFLSPEETQKADGFLRVQNKKQYILAHYLKRYLLERIFGLPGELFQFNLNRRDKPSFNIPGQLTGFNLSHAGNKVLIGFHFNGEIGVDIEKIEPGFDYQAFSGEHYAEGERLLLDKFTGDYNIREQFFLIWTKKEAWLKLTGEGLTDDLKIIDVSKENSGMVPDIFIESFLVGDYAISIAADKIVNKRYFMIR